MDQIKLRELLKKFRNDEISDDDMVNYLKDVPYESLGYATIDHHRSLRQGFPEVIYCQGKSPQQVLEISRKIIERNGKLLATRIPADMFEYVKTRLPEVVYHDKAQAMTLELTAPKNATKYALVITAGTSDVPVAEEAIITIRVMGFRAERLHDVGVAGIHRLLAHRKKINMAAVIVVVAGMEGALASVVGGLTEKLVIAVPTSVGYGSSFGGVAALLTMLNSCAAGVTVVNIDNGFGGGFAAGLVLRSLWQDVE